MSHPRPTSIRWTPKPSNSMTNLPISNCDCPLSLLCLRCLPAPQKLQQRRIELRRLLYLRRVPALIDQRQLRALNVFGEGLAHSERRQSVVLAPEHKCRGFDRFDFAVEEIFAAQNRFDER